MPDQFQIPTFRLPVFVQLDTLDSALPLVKTRVNVSITGPVAGVEVTQHYANPLDEPAELDYLFPLPEEAAITAFKMQIGTRDIQGTLQERDVARDLYEQSRGQRQRSGLFEQRRPNLFALRLANIQPREEIYTTVCYQQRVSFFDGQYEFVYPMGITPKYDRPQSPMEGEDVRAPIAQPGEKIGQVEIQIDVDSGVPSGAPTSPSHELSVSRQDERHFHVTLTGKQIPDHDFVLRYPLAASSVAASGWTSGEAGKEYFLVSMVPPKMEFATRPSSREFIFTLDRSGSMTGEPIAQARNALRACLRTLSEADTFRILLFDDRLEWFKNEPASVTQSQIDRADDFLGKVQGRGGTEIIRALEEVLTLPEDPNRTRFIVFLTDGAVAAESQALETIREKIGSARLFTFGIGPSVNRALLRRMAHLGRGRATFLQLDEDIEGAIIQFQDSVSFPVLTGITLQIIGAKLWDVYPGRLPDLYYGETLEILGRLSRSPDHAAQLRLHGKQGGHIVELCVDLLPPEKKDLVMERLWAQAKIEDLIEQQDMEPARAQKIRAEILGLALDAGLVTPYSSFVAIDQDVAQNGAQLRTIHVAQPLPKGLHLEGFFPQTRMNMMGMIQPASFFSPTASPAMAAGRSGSRSLRSLISKPLEKGERDRVQDVVDGTTLPFHSHEEEAPLRWLARTQRVDGSWDEDVERSSVALMVFVRTGHTTRRGAFRQVLLKVVRWLEDHPGAGLATFLRVLAFTELAQATKEQRDAALAQAARQSLGAPESLLELAALGEPVSLPSAIQTLDDLRLAGMMKMRLPVSPELLRSKGPNSDLISTWLAALPKAS